MRDRLGLLWEIFLAGLYLSAPLLIVLSVALGVWESISRCWSGR